MFRVGPFLSGVLFFFIGHAVAAENSDLNGDPTSTIPYFHTIDNPIFRQIIQIYQTQNASDWVNSMSSLLDKDAVMLQWQGKQTVPIKGIANIQSHLNNEVQHYPELKKKIGRFMLAGGGVGGGADAYHSVLILFYEASTHTKNKKSWVWAGCDIITLSHDKIVSWRVEEDTHMKLVSHPTHIDIHNEYNIIDKHWRPTTTTNDLVGMAYIQDLKRTVMPTAERGKLLLQRMKETIEQSTWEPDGILFLKDKAPIKSMFFDGLLSVLPDFYENIERTLVSGNAFIMIQNPSGTQSLANGKTNHRAWYNCDIYFFDGMNIEALLFQRDTQMDIEEERKGIKQP